MSCTKCGGVRRSEYTTSNHYQTKGLSPSEKMCSCESTPTKVARWTALPLYTDAELLYDMDVIAGSNEEGKAFRLPIRRILAGGDLNRLQYSIDKKSSDIEINVDQVTPAFIPGPNTAVQEAIANDSANKAQFLAISNDPNEKNNIIIQSSGFLTFPRTHSYQVGKTYYLHQKEKGAVTSVRPTEGLVQPLFTVVDELTININIGA